MSIKREQMSMGQIPGYRENSITDVSVLPHGERVVKSLISDSSAAFSLQASASFFVTS